MRRGLLFLVCALFAQGCGDESTTGPTAGSTTTVPGARTIVLTIMSGETSLPAAGAAVTVEGREYSSDENGIVEVEGYPSRNAIVDIRASGFLDRQTMLRSREDTVFTLWPRTSPTGLHEAFTRQIVYTWFEEDTPGGTPLARPRAGTTFYVTASQEVRSDPRAVRVIEEAIAVMNEALQGKVSYQWAEEAPPGAATVEILIDPDAAGSEYASSWRIWWEGWVIYRARFRFRTMRNLVRNGRLMTTSLGHAFGLRSSPDAADRMYRDWWMRRPNDFSDKEVLTMHLMLQRLPGNRFPDNDRQANRYGSRGSLQGYMAAVR